MASTQPSVDRDRERQAVIAAQNAGFPLSTPATLETIAGLLRTLVHEIVLTRKAIEGKR